jgi:hypothetical protein
LETAESQRHYRPNSDTAFAIWGLNIYLLNVVSRTRLNWSRPLPRPLAIPKVMKLKTLTDVRELLSHLPAHVRRKDITGKLANLPTLRAIAFPLERARVGAILSSVGLGEDQRH